MAAKDSRGATEGRRMRKRRRKKRRKIMRRKRQRSERMYEIGLRMGKDRLSGVERQMESMNAWRGGRDFSVVGL